VSGVMTSYNAVNGTPQPANTYTVNELLQRTYGFNGYTTSDCGAVTDIYQSGSHDWAPPGWTTDGSTWTNTATGATVPAAAGAEAYALRAGTDLNCTGTEATTQNIEAALNAGLLSTGVIDTDLVHLFTLRMETGEFDPASKVAYTKIGKSQIQSPAHQALAEQLAASDLVLLKNGDVAGSSSPLLPANPAKLNNVVIVGNLAGTVTLGGYSGDPSLQVSAVQGITSAVKAANPSATVTFDACGTSTTATTPASCSAATQAAIKSADLVIVFAGSDLNVADESHDRASLAMPGNYDSLISQVAALGNPRMALVMQADGPYDISGVQGEFPSIVFSGYNGESQGTALAQVLFGQQDPSGHLNFTWYADDAQLPAMDNYGLTPAQTGGLGRTYQYFTGKPAYPFGYGLSYTTFRYSRVAAGPSSANANGTVHVSFDVTNTGKAAGSTVAQLYVAPKFTVPGVQLPQKQLEGFRKTAVLAPGQTQHVTLSVPVASLSQWDESSLKQVVYDGPYQFQVGSDAATVAGAGTVRVRGAITPRVQSVTVQPDQDVLQPGQTLSLAGANPWIAPDTDSALEQPHASADDVVEAVNNDQSFVNLAHARVTYASSDPAVATVRRDGTVTAVAPGVTTISVTVNGVRGTTPLSVSAPLTATAPADMDAGATSQAATSFTNTGSRPLTGVTLTLAGPGGWTATAATPATFAAIAPGQKVSTTWNVSVPAGTGPGTDELAAGATFAAVSGPGSSSTAATTFVPGTVSVTLGQQNQDNGLSQAEFDSGDGATQPVTVGGESGREAVPTVPPHPNDLDMYFNVDDSVAFDGNYTATFSISYYDEGTGTFTPQYDSTNPKGGDLSGAYTNGPPVQLTNSGTWKTATFTVHDALFGNRENDGTDFRLTSGGSFTIHSVSVTISANS
jgi:beta-glucosidase